MNIRDKILIVEDERSISGFIKTVLVSNGYEVVLAHSGTEAFSMVSSHCPDLVVLDLGLPDIDGMDIIEAIREWTQLPIIVVSARTLEKDKVEALDKGADDYITKPFSAAELLARVRVAIRHTRASAIMSGSQKYVSGDLTVDYDKHMVTVKGENCHLTQNEYKIVALLSRCAGKVLTYDFIMKELWGPQSRGSNQILRVNMANIRRKIEKNPANPKYIFTEVGVGYRMVEAE
ncbi:MAG: response regulator transcription factor [Oscillospiraceae bacterium]|nr:response regulator transcription factor [Oscillospiraceae bacterium]MBP5168130.1 response regulator transcription factor [Oscillospiraceae bacterium]